MSGLIDQSDLLIVSEIADLAFKLGPEIYDAITAAIKTTRPELVPGKLPDPSGAALEAEADKEIARRFHPDTDPAPAPVDPAEL